MLDGSESVCLFAEAFAAVGCQLREEADIGHIEAQKLFKVRKRWELNIEGNIYSFDEPALFA